MKQPSRLRSPLAALGAILFIVCAGTAQAAATHWVDSTGAAVTGYTDSTGSTRYNLALSKRRAEAVKAYLAHKGIAADKITAVGMGESHPVAGNGTATGRARNRRVEIDVQMYTRAWQPVRDGTRVVPSLFSLPRKRRRPFLSHNRDTGQMTVTPASSVRL